MFTRRDVATTPSLVESTDAPAARPRARRRGLGAIASAFAALALAAPVAGATTPVCVAPYGDVPAAGTAPPLTFGIYPGGFAGGGSEDFTPNDPVQIQSALDTLQGNAGKFTVRAYLEFHSAPTDGDESIADPENFSQYLINGRKLDLVLEYDAETVDMQGWRRFVRRAIRHYGSAIKTVDVGLEGNLSGDPVQIPVIVQGARVARQVQEEQGLTHMKIGFDAVNFGVPFDLSFWSELRIEGGTELADNLDFVGVDLYAGAFDDPAPDGQPGDRRDVVTQALKMTRNCSLPTAGLERLPMRITENGWAVFDARTDQQQADAFRTVITTVNDLRAGLDIRGYQAFALRDDKTDSDEAFDHFGLMTDDYTPKPAFGVYTDLIAQLAAQR